MTYKEFIEFEDDTYNLSREKIIKMLGVNYKKSKNFETTDNKNLENKKKLCLNQNTQTQVKTVSITYSEQR